MGKGLTNLDPLSHTEHVVSNKHTADRYRRRGMKAIVCPLPLKAVYKNTGGRHLCIEAQQHRAAGTTLL